MSERPVIGTDFAVGDGSKTAIVFGFMRAARAHRVRFGRIRYSRDKTRGVWIGTAKVEGYA